MYPWTAGEILLARIVAIPFHMMRVGPVLTANIKSVITAIAAARPVTIPSVRAALTPAPNATKPSAAVVSLPVIHVLNAAAGPVCLIEPVPPVLKK